MKVIVAPDSFKGTFTSEQIIEAVQEGSKKHFDAIDIIGVPIADGGEGTVTALTNALKGSYYQCVVKGPYGLETTASYGIVGKTAIMEMAEASGINLVKKDEMNPLKASTFGTGEMIHHALEQGVKSIVIGIGGSATNDGGIGMAAALGVKFYNKEGLLITEYGGDQLKQIDRIDMTGLDDRLNDIDITVICDVTNPLTGTKGATYVYGPQKGAAGEVKEALEAGMCHYAEVLNKTYDMDVNTIQGGGAAGGLGAALVAYLDGHLKTGIEAVLDIVEFDQVIEGADLVITGEGRIDGQSVYGKVPVGVAKRCKKQGIPAIALVGCTGDGYEAVYDYGIEAVFSTVTEPISEELIKKNALINLNNAIGRMFRSVKSTYNIKKDSL